MEDFILIKVPEGYSTEDIQSIKEVAELLTTKWVIIPHNIMVSVGTMAKEELEQLKQNIDDALKVA